MPLVYMILVQIQCITVKAYQIMRYKNYLEEKALLSGMKCGT